MRQELYYRGASRFKKVTRKVARVWQRMKLTSKMDLLGATNYVLTLTMSERHEYFHANKAYIRAQLIAQKLK